MVKWPILFHEDFEPEFDALPEDVQDEMLAHAKLLEQFGPYIGRPRVDNPQRFLSRKRERVEV